MSFARLSFCGAWVASLVLSGLMVLRPAAAQEFSLDGYKTCAQADNGKYYCKTSAAANWQNVPAEFFNRFKQAEAEAASGGSSVSAKELQEVADYLNDLQQFLKDNPTTKNIGDVAKIAIAAKGSVDSQNLAEAKNGRRRLETMFKDDPNYATFMKKMSDDRQKLLDRRIADATVEAGKHLFFIDRFIAGNLLSPHTAELAKLKEGLAKASKEKNLVNLFKANGDLEKFVQAKRLGDEYQSAMLAWTEANSPKNTEDPKSKNALAKRLGITDRSQFMIEGSDDDIVALYNARSGRFAKNLRGDLVFKNPTAVACFAQDQGHPNIRDFERIAIAHVQKRNLNSVKMAAKACEIKDLDSVDLVFFQREGLLGQTENYVTGLVSAVESNGFVQLSVIAGADVVQAIKGDSVNAATVEANLQNGQKTGFGMVFVNPAKADICVVAAQDQTAHHIAIQQRMARVFNVNLTSKDLVFASRSLEDAFADFQSKKCNAIYSQSKDMVELIAALKRERMDYLIAPLWVDPADLDKIKAEQQAEMAALQAKLDAQAKAVAERDKAAIAKQEADRKAAQEQAEIMAKRQLDEAAKRENIEAALQAKNRAFARTAQDKVSLMVDDFLKTNTANRGENVTGPAVNLFSLFAKDITQRTRDRWELEQVFYSVEDFGDVDWQNRKLEAVVVKTMLQMKNPALGRRDQYCYMLGVIIDAEFSMLRDPLNVPCDAGPSAINRWRLGSKFVSRWLAP